MPTTPEPVEGFPPLDPELIGRRLGNTAIPKSPYTHDERPTLADVPE